MKIFLIFFVLTGQYAYSKTVKAKILIADLPPWIEVGNSTCTSGPICDFFNELNVKTDLKISYEVSSLARVNLAAYKGELSMALFPKLPLFDEYYEVIGKVYDYDLGYYSTDEAKKSKARKCTTSKNPHKEKGIKYLEVSDLDQCFKMLIKKRIGGILVTDIELALFLSKNPSYAIGKFNFAKKLSLWLYVNKKSSLEKKKSIKHFFKTYDTQPIQNKYLIINK